MVFALIAIGVIAVALFTFRDQIKNALDDLRKPKTEQEVVREERGAIENTQAFILGEQGLADLKATSEANKIAIDKFFKDAQTNLQSNITGVNETLVQSQQNLEKFAQESQATIVSNVNQFQKDVATNVSGIGEGLGKFFEESRLNLENIFGGQAKPKPVSISIPTTQPFSISPTFGNITNFSPTGKRIGTSPNLLGEVIKTASERQQDLITKEGKPIENIKAVTRPVLEREAIKNRFSGAGSRR